jgi:hypothetical protein
MAAVTKNRTYGKIAGFWVLTQNSEEKIFEKVYDGRRWTPSDGNSSPGPLS